MTDRREKIQSGGRILSFLRYFFALCGRGLECQSDFEPYIVQTVDLVYE